MPSTQRNSVSKHLTGRPRRLASLELVSKGGSIGLEYLDSADASLVGYRLYGDRHCQLRRLGEGNAAAVGNLFAVAPARLAHVQRSIFVRAAIPHQLAQPEEDMKKPDASQSPSASELISKRIADLGDWRGKTLARMRKLIKQADPEVVEEWKWMGTPIWSHDGIICTGESYKNHVKLTF